MICSHVACRMIHSHKWQWLNQDIIQVKCYRNERNKNASKGSERIQRFIQVKWSARLNLQMGSYARPEGWLRFWTGTVVGRQARPRWPTVCSNGMHPILGIQSQTGIALQSHHSLSSCRPAAVCKLGSHADWAAVKSARITRKVNPTNTSRSSLPPPPPFASHFHYINPMPLSHTCIIYSHVAPASQSPSSDLLFHITYTPECSLWMLERL